MNEMYKKYLEEKLLVTAIQILLLRGASEEEITLIAKRLEETE